MTPLFISPETPRWTPKTESDLQDAINGGLIEETHNLDAKREVVSKGDNRELARDLVSFANDGGVLIVGLEEDKTTGTFALAPQPLNGLPEKIEQVAWFTPDPSLNIVCTTIPSDADSSKGYVIVQIPASPLAPHMVDHYYFGRGDKTKHKLSNDEVIRLVQRRRVVEQDALDMLADEISNDPVKDGTGQGHLFLLAQPQASRPDMTLGLIGTTNWNTRMQQLAMRAHPGELNTLPEVSPSLLDTNSYRRARGAARATSNLGEGRIFVPNPMMTGAIELQVFEDGGLRLFFSRLTVNLTGDEAFISDPAAVALTRRFLTVVLAVAEEASYVGPWSLAIGGTGLHKLRAAPDHTRFATTARYSDEEYRQATAATWAELTQAPGAVTRRLLGPLLRSLAIEYRYDEVLTDPTPDIGQQP